MTTKLGKLKPIKYRDYTIEIIKNSPSTFMYNINNSGWVILYAPNKEHVLKKVKKEVDWLLKYTPIAARYKGRW